MKRKVGTLIEEDVFRLAKRRALEENRPLNDLIQDALVAYLNRRSPDPQRSSEAYHTFCEQPIRISRDQLEIVLEEDTWAP